MYTQRQDIKADVELFLNKLDELSRDDRRRLLTAMFEKHFVLNEGELVVTRFEFANIQSAAKSEFVRQPVPMRFSNAEVSGHELTHIAMFESIISYLNSKNALRRQPNLDIKKL